MIVLGDGISESRGGSKRVTPRASAPERRGAAGHMGRGCAAAAVVGDRRPGEALARGLLGEQAVDQLVMRPRAPTRLPGALRLVAVRGGVSLSFLAALILVPPLAAGVVALNGVMLLAVAALQRAAPAARRG
jgi:hypothetical protein